MAAEWPRASVSTGDGACLAVYAGASDGVSIGQSPQTCRCIIWVHCRWPGPYCHVLLPAVQTISGMPGLKSVLFGTLAQRRTLSAGRFRPDVVVTELSSVTYRWRRRETPASGCFRHDGQRKWHTYGEKRHDYRLGRARQRSQLPRYRILKLHHHYPLCLGFHVPQHPGTDRPMVPRSG